MTRIRSWMRNGACFRAPWSWSAYGVLALLVCLAGSGCTSFATLTSVTKEDRLASEAELRDVEIIRQGEILETMVGMPLKKGDAIRTASDTEAVIELAAGYKVYVGGESELTILNPKLLLRIGRAFIETLERIRDALTVEEEYVVAGIKGTEFQLTVGEDDVVTCTVVEGTVTLESKMEPPAWEPVTYGALEQVTVVRDLPPDRIRRLRPDEVEAAIAWVREVQRVTTRVVPPLEGRMLEDARRIIEDAQLNVGSVRYRATGEAEAGVIIGQDPMPGTMVDVGTRISLQVEKEVVLVPEVANVGMSFDEASRRLQASGLRVGRVKQTLSERAADGAVLSQNPRAGARVDPGTVVSLEVAQAGVRVPDVRGLTEREATARIRRAGLTPGPVSNEVTRQHPAGTVIRTAPTARTLVPAGSAVEIVIALIPGPD